MPLKIEMTAGSPSANRSLLANLGQGAKLLLGGVEHTLNFLFSFVVLVAAALTAAWLHGQFGDYPLRGFADACVILTWLAMGFTLAGCYIHAGLLNRDWVQLCAVSAIAVATLWIRVSAIVCWVPLFVLLGGAVAEAVIRRTANEPAQRTPLHQRLPRPLCWLLPRLTFIIGIGVPLLVLNLIVFAMSGLARQEFQGRAVPNVVFETADGTPWRMADQRGKVVLLDFWAPWCGPCRAAVPELKALHKKYADRNDFLLVGASEENDRKRIADFCHEHNISWLQVFLPRKPLTDGVHPDKLTRPGIPSAWIINRDGVVVGADLRGRAVTETLDRLMHQQ